MYIKRLNVNTGHVNAHSPRLYGPTPENVKRIDHNMYNVCVTLTVRLIGN